MTKIKAGVPQGTGLGRFLYLLYTNDSPQQQNSEIATFTNGTTILAVGRNKIRTLKKLQDIFIKTNRYTKVENINKWCILIVVFDETNNNKLE